MLATNVPSRINFLHQPGERDIHALPKLGNLAYYLLGRAMVKVHSKVTHDFVALEISRGFASTCSLPSSRRRRRDCNVNHQQAAPHREQVCARYG